MDCSLSRIPLTTRAFPRNQTITGCHLSAVLVKFVIIALSVINYNVSTNKDHFLRLSDFKYYLVGPAHPLVASSHLMIKANQRRFTMTIVGTNGNVSMVGNFMAPFLAISGPTHLHCSLKCCCRESFKTGSWQRLQESHHCPIKFLMLKKTDFCGV